MINLLGSFLQQCLLNFQTKEMVEQCRNTQFPSPTTSFVLHRMPGGALKSWGRLSCQQQKESGTNLLQRCNSLGTNELLLYYNASNIQKICPFVRAILRFSTITVR